MSHLSLQDSGRHPLGTMNVCVLTHLRKLHINLLFPLCYFILIELCWYTLCYNVAVSAQKQVNKTNNKCLCLFLFLGAGTFIHVLFHCTAVPKDLSEHVNGLNPVPTWLFFLAQGAKPTHQ